MSGRRFSPTRFASIVKRASPGDSRLKDTAAAHMTLPVGTPRPLSRLRFERSANFCNSFLPATPNGKLTRGCDGADVSGDFVESAFGTGNNLVGAQAFEDFREF